MAAVPDDREHCGSVQGDEAGAEQPSRAQDRGTLCADRGIVGDACLLSRATARYRIPQPVQCVIYEVIVAEFRQACSSNTYLTPESG